MRTLANAAKKLKRRGSDRHLPTLWLMTDTERMPDPAAAVARLPRGSAVILRHYDDPARTSLARQLAILCRVRGIVFLVAGDWRLAAQIGADGIHLPDYMARDGLSPGAKLWLRARYRPLTVAAHTVVGLRRAAALNVSAVLLAPVFPTQSHPDKVALGAQRFGILTRAACTPVIALGGVSKKMMPSLMTSGCVGIAGIGFAVSA